MEYLHIHPLGDDVLLEIETPRSKEKAREKGLDSSTNLLIMASFSPYPPCCRGCSGLTIMEEHGREALSVDAPSGH